ncbi:ribosomal protein S18-alanine N-acetyltransferase [Aquincola sp. S2]|uniref:[Ribosomal protein bS18]-alanine N-acetyltransferase n=1 Tax=Pseudaquabacterium terrae TaxID=2732868 RepID=A0ABX2ED56_9BURK|nr:ribosomal protein S18-alanine N-acetyltransferase [Aquabacterium terrae]NRF66706.1 ribosomal protein S18-alanine N-acetyltransferase [Aquabacterium terrae]
MNALMQPGAAWQRPMRVADLDTVLAIEAQCYSHPWTRGNFVDSLAAGYWAELRLDAAGQCLGYFVAMPGVDEMHLLNLTVTPHHQRQGHAWAMLLDLRERALQRGDRQLWLEVRQSNQVARALYGRFGFTDAGVRRSYYPAAGARREDAVVMSLVLDGGADALD